MRIGVLGAARITKTALLDPAKSVPGVEVTAIAARDSARAHSYAAKHRIPRVCDTYDDLLACEEIDAVYIPLPAALHGAWVRAAISAGKHVLVEKPFASNEIEASAVASLATSSDSIVMEAYHTAHHPFTARIREIVAGGALGQVTSAEAVFCVPIPPGRSIQWNLALGGGGLLDVGYYPVRQLRDIFGTEPTVIGARARQRDGIDSSLEGSLRFDTGAIGKVMTSIWSRRLYASRMEIRGTAGLLRVSSPYHPHLRGSLTLDVGGARRREHASRRSTYTYQLEAFRDLVAGVSRNVTDSSSAVAQMAIIDDLYRAAGMSPRMPAPPARRVASE